MTNSGYADDDVQDARGCATVVGWLGPRVSFRAYVI